MKHDFSHAGRGAFGSGGGFSLSAKGGAGQYTRTDKHKVQYQDYLAISPPSAGRT